MSPKAMTYKILESFINFNSNEEYIPENINGGETEYSVDKYYHVFKKEFRE